MFLLDRVDITSVQGQFKIFRCDGSLVVFLGMRGNPTAAESIVLSLSNDFSLQIFLQLPPAV